MCVPFSVQILMARYGALCAELFIGCQKREHFTSGVFKFDSGGGGGGGVGRMRRLNNDFSLTGDANHVHTSAFAAYPLQ